MREQDEFFTKKHDKLLAISVWAKYIAWLVLIVSILVPIAVYIQRQNEFNYFTRFQSGMVLDFSEMLVKNPLYTVSLYVELLNITLRGIVSFLVLKGISLGLNMIIETDLNYRENTERGALR